MSSKFIAQGCYELLFFFFLKVWLHLAVDSPTVKCLIRPARSARCTAAISWRVNSIQCRFWFRLINTENVHYVKDEKCLTFKLSCVTIGSPRLVAGKPNRGSRRRKFIEESTCMTPSVKRNTITKISFKSKQNIMILLYARPFSE